MSPACLHRFAPVAIMASTALGWATPAPAGQYTVPVINLSGLELQELYITTSENDLWGNDYLGDRSIVNEDALNVHIEDEANTCYYDVWGIFGAADADAADLREATFWAVDLCHVEQTGGLVFLPHDLYDFEDFAATDKFIRVINNSDEVLLLLQATPAGTVPDVERDPNLIANTLLQPLEHYAFPLSQLFADAAAIPTSCPYDITIHALKPTASLEGDIADDDIVVVPPFTLDLCSDDIDYLEVGEGNNIETIYVDNTTDMTLAELYIAPQSAPDWGLDQLIFTVAPDDVDFIPLPVARNSDDGCGLYDVLAIFYRDADSPSSILHERTGIDLCAMDEFVLDFPDPATAPDAYYEVHTR